MYPRIFDVSYLNSFGLCYAIGLILCFFVLRRYVKKKGINPKFGVFLEGNGYIAILVGFLCAILAQDLFVYIKDPSKGFHLTFSSTGLSGILGGAGSFIIGYLIWGRRRYGPRVIEVVAIGPACIAIAQACGRLGCFCGGCCYGKQTSSWLGLHFPHLGHPVYPTQLMEAGFMFLLFALLYHLAVRRDFKHTFVVYMIGYGVFRFCIEFIRGDERGALIGNLSPSQTLSLLLVAGSVWVYFIVARLQKDYDSNKNLPDKVNGSAASSSTL